MDKTRAAYFSPAEQKLLMKLYEEVKHIICQKGNTAAIIKERGKAWQTIADRINATKMCGQKRTWQQVKIKYKNVLRAALKKKAQACGTGRGPLTQDFTTAEELVLEENEEKPVVDEIQGRTATDVRDDDETASLESRRLEYPDPVQPSHMNSQSVRHLYTRHLEKRIELADSKIQVNKRKLQDMELDMEIKHKTLRKLDLEIRKLEREASDFRSHCNHD